MRLLFIGDSSLGNPLRQALDVLFPRPLASMAVACPCVLGAYANIPLLSAGTRTVKHLVSRKNRSCGRKRNVAGEVPISWGDGIGMLVANRCAWLTTKKREKGPCPALSPALSKSPCSVRNGTSGALSYTPERETVSQFSFYILPWTALQGTLAGVISVQATSIMLEV
jgi:hypothetical protein